MKQAIPNRIHIIGSVGSGKTTLAKTLSKRYNIPYYELDNVVWERHKSGDIRRSEEDRDTYLKQIVETESWIIEGAHNHEWVRPSFERADLIIFLDTPNAVRIGRIIKRYIRQVLRVEEANYTPTFKIFLNMFKWNKTFEKESKPKILEMVQKEKMKTMIIKDNKNINYYFE
ncbi:AAA family ATPase [Bacillus alkalicellulosilyticus]|uniref:AAA family ATPase n=1 Tax=Alkalihalobacterium alkalicellulosilyticum TaxID=1912214 RepID=UPI0009979291|nr:AAA family ATPase [Bacillus alkalicellulosilyticus]